MKKNANFLMSPTVDYCFKELLAYPEIRKGFVAAVLNKAPEEIKETILMPTKGCIFSEPAKLLNFLTTDGSKDTGF